MTDCGDEDSHKFLGVARNKLHNRAESATSDDDALKPKSRTALRVGEWFLLDSKSGDFWLSVSARCSSERILYVKRFL